MQGTVSDSSSSPTACGLGRPRRRRSWWPPALRVARPWASKLFFFFRVIHLNILENREDTRAD